MSGKQTQNKCLMLYLQWILLAGLLLACGRQEQGDSPVRDADLGYIITTADDLMGLAASLSARLSDISFQVFVQCGAEATNAKDVSSYTLGEIKSYTLSASCSDPQVEIKNLELTYQNTSEVDTVANFATYGSFNHDGSTLVFEKLGGGRDASFRLREPTIAVTTSATVVVPTAPVGDVFCINGSYFARRSGGLVSGNFKVACAKAGLSSSVSGPLHFRDEMGAYTRISWTIAGDTSLCSATLDGVPLPGNLASNTVYFGDHPFSVGVPSLGSQLVIECHNYVWAAHSTATFSLIGF